MSEVGSMETGKEDDKALCMKRCPDTGEMCKLTAGHQGRHDPMGIGELPDKWDALRNIHGEILPEKYRFTEEDEKRLDSLDFYTHRDGAQLPPSDITEADRFMAWRWYGQFMVPCTEERIGAMAWRISRERQLLSKLRGMDRCTATGEPCCFGIHETSGEWQCADCGRLRPLRGMERGGEGQWVSVDQELPPYDDKTLYWVWREGYEDLNADKNGPDVTTMQGQSMWYTRKGYPFGITHWKRIIAPLATLSVTEGVDGREK